MVDPIVFRGIERLLILVIAALCLWIAYRIGHGREASSGSFQWETLSIELKKIGPSVFFGLFGTVIVVYAILSPLELVTTSHTNANQASTTVKQTTRYLTAQDELRSQRILSDFYNGLSPMGAFIRQVENDTLTSSEREDLVKLMRKLFGNRRQLKSAAFGDELVSRFEDYLARCSIMSELSTEKCKAIEKEIGRERIKAMNQFVEP